MTLFPSKQLAILASANFVIGMGAFVVIGILAPLARDLAVQRNLAGGLITWYALVYAICSPLLVAKTGRAQRRLVLSVALLIFGVGAAVAAVAPSFDVVIAGRVVMAVGGGLLTPIAASTGVALAGPEHRDRALAWVFGGLTLAQVIGIPAGAWLGYAFGWRAAFMAVGFMASIGAVIVWRALPRDLHVPPSSLESLVKVLSTPILVMAISFTAFFIGSIYVFYTYMGPFMESRYGVGRDGVAVALLVFGLGAVIGNWLGQWGSRRLGPVQTLLALCGAQVLLLPVISRFEMPLPSWVVLVGIWSACCWSFMVPQQSRLASLAPEQIQVCFALNAAALYLGGSLGSAIGGRTLEWGGFGSLGAVAAGLAIVAAASLLLSARRRVVT